MSRIDDLIRQFAPGGIEYKPLGEVARIKTGPNVSKKVIAERPGPFPVVNSGREPLGYIDEYNTENDPIGIASRGSVGLVTWTPGRYFRGNLNYSCSPTAASKLDSRFLYHYLLFADADIQALATHQGIPALNAGSLKTLRVPVPPLEVQREIAKILDTFTELGADLEAELEARKHQYAHYRDTLLSFREGARVRWANLGDIGLIYGGLTGKSKADFADGNAPFITYMNVFNNLSTDLTDGAFVRVGPNERQTAVKFGDVLFTASSESRREVGMASAVTAEPIQPTYLNSFCFGFRPRSTDELDPEFAKHLFRARVMRDQIVKTANGVTRINISKGPFGKMAVPLPSIEEQKRIAEVLDKFEALVNDLSSGLPAEIEARRQQGAYYRDRLLSFEEAAG